MESVLGRYRNLIILVGVLFLQVLGLAMQVKRSANEAQDTRLIRIWAVGALSPFERALVWTRNSTGALWHNYFYLRGVRAENRQLKEQIEQMRLEQVRLTEDAAQAHRLQNLLAFKEQFISKTIAAQVIGSSGSDFSRIVYIDKGENAGIKRDMAVITAEGIVGKVLLVYPSLSQVLLISDQSSGVGALLEKSRLQGVLKGTANGEVMLERVMSDEDVTVGENILTSGGDQIFPKGLRVGTVARVDKGKDLFMNIKIRPAASLSRLEEVLVILEKQEKNVAAEDGVRVRAADILAQRLPSVPDKPAATADQVLNGAGAPKPAAPSASPANKTAAPALAPAPKTSGPSAANTNQKVTDSSSAAQPRTKPADTLPGAKPQTAPASTDSATKPKPPAVQTAPPSSPPSSDDNSPH